MKTGKIYLITNTVNGKRYIGQTWRTLEERWQQHCYDAKREDFALSRAIRKYGADAFTIQLICEKVAVSQQNLDGLEQSFIQNYETLSPNGYNLKEGGRGGKLSVETRKKIGDAIKGENNGMYGRGHLPESRAKMSETRRGTPLSVKHRRKIGEGLKGNENGKAHKGKSKSAEHRRKIGDAHKGRTKSAKHRRRLSEANMGKTHSAETRQKMSDAQKARWSRQRQENNKKQLTLF